MDYTCKRCGYDAKTLVGLKKHYHRKTVCKALLANQSYEELLKELEAPLEEDTKTKVPLGKRDGLCDFSKFLLSQKYIDDEWKLFFGDEEFNMRLGVYEDTDSDKDKIEKLKKTVNFLLELILENKLLLFKFHEDMTKLKKNMSFTSVSDSSLQTLVD